VAAVDFGQRRAADLFPGVDDAAPGEQVIEQEAAPLGVQRPGGGD